MGIWKNTCNEKINFQLHQITMATTARPQKQASQRPVGASLAAGTSPPAQSQNQQKPLAELITVMDKNIQFNQLGIIDYKIAMYDLYNVNTNIKCRYGLYIHIFKGFIEESSEVKDCNICHIMWHGKKNGSFPKWTLNTVSIVSSKKPVAN